MTKLIELFIQNHMKNSELRILKLIDEHKKLRISQLVVLANWYQIRNIIPKLEKLGLIEKEEEIKGKAKIEWLKINYENEVIKTLFGEVK